MDLRRLVTVLLRLVAVFLLPAVVATACGQKQSQVLADATEDESSGSSPGVTDDEVKVGVIVIDQTNLQATLGFETPDQGDQEGAIQTLADHVNANGGIGGRKMVPVIRVFDALTDSAVTEEKLCRSFTEDDKVFAVVLLGMFQDNARPCYAAQDTLMLDQTQFPVDHASAAELSPYYYQPSLPEYGEVLAGLTVALDEEDFLTEETRLGIIGIDNEQNRRVFDEQLLPSLESLGAEPVDTQWVDPTSNATLQAGQNQAVLSFKERDVDRVIIVGGSRLLAFLLSITVPQDYFPAYAVTTFDNPNFVASGTPEAMVGAVGISALPTTDLAPGELPFPDSEGEQRCLDILAEGGHDYQERNNATEAFFYCDAVLLLADALRGAEGGDLTAAAFQDGAAALGETPNASNYLADYREDFFAGAAGYRPMRFSEDCGCFELVGETTAFPR
jgi:hypothetical protein